MKKQKQFEELAVLEGLVGIHYDGEGVLWGTDSSIKGQDNFPHMVIVPDYDSHDALQMVVDGLDYSDLIDYRETLYDMPEFVREYDHHKATPAQKREAILKATGLWEEGE